MCGVGKTTQGARMRPEMAFPVICCQRVTAHETLQMPNGFAPAAGCTDRLPGSIETRF
jgi:hypothetical protein